MGGHFSKLPANHKEAMSRTAQVLHGGAPTTNEADGKEDEALSGHAFLRPMA